LAEPDQVLPPATTGNEAFNRIFRAQVNSFEQLVMFLPALYIASKYWPNHYIAAAGVCYLIGRVIYWRSYVVGKDRSIGFVLTAGATVSLLVMGLVGIFLR
jgi:glutathione S-transferase